MSMYDEKATPSQERKPSNNRGRLVFGIFEEKYNPLLLLLLGGTLVINPLMGFWIGYGIIYPALYYLWDVFVAVILLKICKTIKCPPVYVLIGYGVNFLFASFFGMILGFVCLCVTAMVLYYNAPYDHDERPQ